MKSKIRILIENIISWPKDDVCSYPVYVDKMANGQYRMKFVFHTASGNQIKKIEKLPHVVKAENTRGYFGGISAYFDIRPSQIEC